MVRKIVRAPALWVALMVGAAPTIGQAQAYLIGTVAGGGLPQNQIPAVSASFGEVYSVAVDATGNLYFAAGNCVFRVDTAGVLTRVAGTSVVPGYSGDDGQATSARLNGPVGVAVDSTGNLYIADVGNNRIRKVTAAGTITTVAGNGVQGYFGDGSSAMNAELNNPYGVAVDGSGNLYISDSLNDRIRKVAAGTGIITTVAGSGSAGYSGDKGPAINAEFYSPQGIAVDGSGDLFIADTGNGVVREVAAATGIITTVAGNGSSCLPGYPELPCQPLGDGGAATSAQLSYPAGVAVDSSGNIFIADTVNLLIREVAAATGIITTVAGNGTILPLGDGGLATNAGLDGPEGVAVDSSGNVYIADTGNYRIREVVASSRIITTVAGSGTSGTQSYSGDNGPATEAQLDLNGRLYPGLTVDSSGNILIADTGNNVIRKVTAATGVITTVVGSGTQGYSGDGELAINAEISDPSGVTLDGSGNLYFADTGNNVIREVTAAGIIMTVAGNGTAGYSGDGKPAINAQLSAPFGVKVDGSGNLFIADTENSVIRKVSAGIIATFAGNGTQCGFVPCQGNLGDGGPATNAVLNQPSSVALDASGNVYIADTFNARIREVAAATNNISTVAGNGMDSGTIENGILATNASLRYPSDVALDGSGNLYIADRGYNDIRKVVAGIISTLAGNGSNTAPIFPGGVAIGPKGQVVTSDELYNVVIVLNDSGVPALEVTANNISSTDHLTFNLLVQSSGGSQQSAAKSEFRPSTVSTQPQPATAAGPSGGALTVGGTVQFTQTLVTDASLPNPTNVVVGNSLPPSWAIAGCASDSGGTCSVTGGSTINLSYPVIDASQPPTYTLTADGPMSDSVLVSSSATTGASAFQNLSVSPGASITLNFQSPSSVPAGQTITYTASLNNNPVAGAKLAGDPLTVTIPLDPNLTGVTAPVPGTSDPSWNCTRAGNTLVCSDSSAVAPNGQTSFEVTGVVSPNAPVGGTLSTAATLTFGGQTSAAQSPGTLVNPPPPSGPTLVSPANGATGLATSVTLNWSPVANATSYTVHFGTTNPPPTTSVNTVLLNYSPPAALTAGTIYYWQVYAVNSSGSTPSATWFFIPGTPSGCQFELNSGNTASLTSAGTSTGGVLPEVPVTVGITPATGAGCSGSYTATSSASWLSATFNGNSFAYTALSNAHSTPQSATLTITNSNGGSQMFTVTEAGDTAEPITTRQVRALYESMLGRDPDSGGFTFWTGVGGAGLGQMADDFLTSPEAFNSDFAVVATYQAATGAVPGYANFITAVGKIRSGAQTIPQLFSALMGGVSGYSATMLYENLLGRAPGSGDNACIATGLVQCFQTLIGYSDASGPTPYTVANNEFQSTGTFANHSCAQSYTIPCAGDHTNTLYITMLYYTILDRDLDTTGYQFWVAVANIGGAGILFQGAEAYPARIQILGPGTPNQGFIGSVEFQGLYQ